MDKTINVGIVDDHEIFRNGLKFLLSKIKNVNLLFEASNGKEFLDLLQQFGKETNIVFMDISMPEINGFQATALALKNFKNLKIVALSSSEDIDTVHEMLIAGVEGYMLKNSGYKDFCDAIEKIYNGQNYFSEKILLELSKNVSNKHIRKKIPESVPEFTIRELEVLKLICAGYSPIQIAEALNISKRTVEGHRSTLISKTNSSNTVTLVIFAFKNNLV